jgi:hypothetical protein
MVIVAILTVRRAELEAFRSFERIAVESMRRCGGRVERTVVVDDGVDPLLKEIHIAKFVNAAAFESYRSDPQVAEVRHLRDVAVVDTQVFIGEDGPVY